MHSVHFSNILLRNTDGNYVRILILDAVSASRPHCALTELRPSLKNFRQVPVKAYRGVMRCRWIPRYTASEVYIGRLFYSDHTGSSITFGDGRCAMFITGSTDRKTTTSPKAGDLLWSYESPLHVDSWRLETRSGRPTSISEFQFRYGIDTT